MPRSEQRSAHVARSVKRPLLPERAIARTGSAVGAGAPAGGGTITGGGTLGAVTLTVVDALPAPSSSRTVTLGVNVPAAG